MKMHRMSIALLVMSLLALGMSACTPKPKPKGPAVGCYGADPVGAVDDLSYEGPLGGPQSYANLALWGSRDDSCSGTRISGNYSLVLATSAGAAITACLAGPEPEVTGAFQLNQIWPEFAANAWMCQADHSTLPNPGECFSEGDLTFTYVGPKNTANNAVLHTGGCNSPVEMQWMMAFHPDPAKALLICKSRLGNDAGYLSSVVYDNLMYCVAQ